jgi:6-phosphofructokinase
MKRLAILASGGDCSGMNATIRAATRTAIANNGQKKVSDELLRMADMPGI